jgi:signal transduction histidine kinase
LHLLTRIGQLYAIEAEIRGQSADVRQSIRQERPRPLVTALRAALDDALRKLSPKSSITKAIRYGIKRWVAFTRFLGPAFWAPLSGRC